MTTERSIEFIKNLSSGVANFFVGLACTHHRFDERIEAAPLRRILDVQRLNLICDLKNFTENAIMHSRDSETKMARPTTWSLTRGTVGVWMTYVHIT